MFSKVQDFEGDLAKIPSVEMTIEVHTFRKCREHELWSHLSLNRNGKRSCEITIISFSRSICRGGLAALIGVTEKPSPSCLSSHSHPIRPCGHLPLEGKAAIREYHLLKKGGEAATRALNPSYQSTHSAFLPPSFGRRCPEGAEVGCVKRYFHTRGCQPRLASLVCPFQRKGRE